jgi:hypothetical protein
LIDSIHYARVAHREAKLSGLDAGFASPAQFCGPARSPVSGVFGGCVFSGFWKEITRVEVGLNGAGFEDQSRAAQRIYERLT